MFQSSKQGNNPISKFVSTTTYNVPRQHYSQAGPSTLRAPPNVRDQMAQQFFEPERYRPAQRLGMISGHLVPPSNLSLPQNPQTVLFDTVWEQSRGTKNKQMQSAWKQLQKGQQSLKQSQQTNKNIIKLQKELSKFLKNYENISVESFIQKLISDFIFFAQKDFNLNLQHIHDELIPYILDQIKSVKPNGSGYPSFLDKLVGLLDQYNYIPTNIPQSEYKKTIHSLIYEADSDNHWNYFINNSFPYEINEDELSRFERYVLEDDIDDEELEIYTKSYDIDLTKCIFCGFCEESCPVDSIVVTPEMHYHFEERGQNILHKDKLLAIGDLYEEQLKKVKAQDAPYK